MLDASLFRKGGERDFFAGLRWLRGAKDAGSRSAVKFQIFYLFSQLQLKVSGISDNASRVNLAVPVVCREREIRYLAG